MKIRLYTTDACPKCRALKVYLIEKGITFDIREMANYRSYLDARDAWPRDCAAPVLEKIVGKTSQMKNSKSSESRNMECSSTFYDHYDLFDRNGLKKSSIDFIVGEI